MRNSRSEIHADWSMGTFVTSIGVPDPLFHYSHSTMTIEHNNSDAKLFTHPSSPISTLHLPGPVITNTITRSSGSSGSLSGRHTHINATGWSQFSDISTSSDDYITPSHHRYRQSGSCTSSSNVLPAGNICPSEKLSEIGICLEEKYGSY